ncbi:hypothetical protein CAFEA_04365 [Corynebacterium afermentans subsp. afermentans]|uniref:EcsC protein family protein n=1 Tax=Corynebacterium afermentans TaxID=38286 RepID=A0A9X8R1T1_9CORY|nr:hypothetical protein [Corynebacterium afermentans]MDC7108014.1 hypothetical protein [Corynebacterium afermentans]WJY56485.1 hypothetical protein CAFEA_04365 [Corynebacterium afermentans subsp. afermentans]SIQ06167.1 hypothetical protein SAMN05421802_10581 [Corynebacterium afermentans]
MFGTKKKSKDLAVRQEIDEALREDPTQLEKDAGPLGRAFIGAVDKAVQLQTSTIRTYVDWLRRQNPDATPAEIQKLMDKHLKNTVTGTGAGVGAAAAVPGIGLFAGAAAVAGESVLFLDLAAFYAVASAYLRGEDIADPERRRTLVLSLLMGTKGLAIVDAMLGDDAGKIPGKSTLAKFSGPTLANTNSVLERIATRSIRKTLRRAWLGKLMPLGIGAIAGTTANRKLADGVIDNVQSGLSAMPAAFASPLPEKDTDEDGKGLSLNPKEFAAWILRQFKDDKKDDKEDTKDGGDN